MVPNFEFFMALFPQSIYNSAIKQQRRVGGSKMGYRLNYSPMIYVLNYFNLFKWQTIGHELWVTQIQIVLLSFYNRINYNFLFYSLGHAERVKTILCLKSRLQLWKFSFLKNVCVLLFFIIYFSPLLPLNSLDG